MKFENRLTGQIGEGIAANYLEKRGYEVIKRNFSTRFGEIDLICKDKDTVVFVEVKTKKGLDFGTPEEMFTQGKKQRVRNMAMVFLEGREVACRIDMVAVELDSENRPIRVTHYENVGGG
jgi:putative endonuclease